MSDRTHTCIALGPSGNFQGLLKCFDLLLGKVVKRRTFRVLPLTTGVLSTINRWGKSSQVLQYGTRLEFLNRIQKRFNWDNDDLIETEGLDRNANGELRRRAGLVIG